MSITCTIRKMTDVPVLHAANWEKAVVVVDVHIGVLRHEPMHGLVIVQRVARAYELVRPPDVVDKLSVVRCSGETCNVRSDRLCALVSQRHVEQTETRTLACPGSISSAMRRTSPL